MGSTTFNFPDNMERFFWRTKISFGNLDIITNCVKNLLLQDPEPIMQEKPCSIYMFLAVIEETWKRVH